MTREAGIISSILSALSGDIFKRFEEEGVKNLEKMIQGMAKMRNSSKTTATYSLSLETSAVSIFPDKSIKSKTTRERIGVVI